MKAYIQTSENGEFYNVNAFIAYEGLSHFGFETEKYIDADDLTDFHPEDIVVGGIGNVRKRLRHLKIFHPEKEIDYPEELKPFLKRKIWSSTINTLFENKDKWNIFIKPKTETKLFAGKIVADEKDFLGIISDDRDTEIWCSELMNFKTEWRCFIRYGEILDIRRYKGAWDTALDVKTVQSALEAFTSRPRAFAMDFGLNNNNETVLVEVNDGHSLGTYGISALNYAKFLSARWSELTSTEDYLNF
ncbi:ATP-grasp domain-containing protein [uncultured Chryseobacterium sp.]|uniref:ATP-grasp domain-containing protein n=1 Tax=uncultured Chryseobacterium sp. TaxID=259322 RepID=UPI002600360F|nr:ATP-grasp domain-containing protein [uncultured Chryseobacterium sp.]